MSVHVAASHHPFGCRDCLVLETASAILTPAAKEEGA
jgi:hypothetical protein